jgi:hypothetical protein
LYLKNQFSGGIPRLEIAGDRSYPKLARYKVSHRHLPLFSSQLGMA